MVPGGELQAFISATGPSGHDGTHHEKASYYLLEGKKMQT